MLCCRQVAGWVIAELSHGSWAQMVKVSLKAVTDFSLEVALVTAQYKKIYCTQQVVLTGCYAPTDPQSQLIKASLAAFASFHMQQLYSVTAPAWDNLIGHGRNVSCWQFLFCCDLFSLAFLIVCDTWLGTLLHMHYSYYCTCLVLMMEYPGNWFCFVSFWHVAFLLECNISYG